MVVQILRKKQESTFKLYIGRRRNALKKVVKLVLVSEKCLTDIRVEGREARPEPFLLDRCFSVACIFYRSCKNFTTPFAVKQHNHGVWS